MKTREETAPSFFQSVLNAFRSINLSVSPNLTSTGPFCPLVSEFSTHTHFTYTNDSQYSVSIGFHPQGYGKIPRRFRRWLPLRQAELVVENEKVVGFGWNNMIMVMCIRDGGGMKQSEVWFVDGT